MGDEPNRDQVEGRTDQAAGEVKEVVGQATGDKTLEREGAQEKTDGAAQQDRGDTRSEIVEETAREIGEKVADDVETMRKEAGLDKK